MDDSGDKVAPVLLWPSAAPKSAEPAKGGRPPGSPRPAAASQMGGLCGWRPYGRAVETAARRHLPSVREHVPCTASLRNHACKGQDQAVDMVLLLLLFSSWLCRAIQTT